MNKILKKALVAAMALTMCASASITAFAAGTTIYTPCAVRKDALAYFGNYPSDKNNVSAEKFLDKVEADERMTVIDIRSAADYEKGHIEGAINVPYGTDIAKQLHKIPTNQSVLVYCYSGQTASQTTALLRMADRKAYNVSGGWNKISVEDDAKALTTTEATNFTTKVYSVDEDNKEAMEKYYVQASANGKFNMSPAAVKDALANKEIFLLDVRSAADHAAGHIEGVGMNIPFGDDMQTSFDKLPKDKKIVVQCYSGQTASQTVATLRMLGFDAWNMSGGTGAVGGSGWLGAGFELTK